MKKLGLIGGIGPESTVAYYRKIIHGIQEIKGFQTLPRLSIESMSAFQVFEFCRENRFDDLAKYILNAINSLASGGAEMVALTGNTPNIVLDKLRNSSPIPIISAIDATVNIAQQQESKCIGLLGTSFTMTNSFFKEPFESVGIKIITPNIQQISYIQSKIESELEHGIVLSETRDAFIEIINEMHKHSNIQKIILGCTELPLLLNDNVSPVPCLDTMDIHVAALIKAMCEA